MKTTIPKLRQIIRKVIVESDQWKGVLPDELWRLGDYEDWQDSGIDLTQYSREHLQMKIDQIDEEIEEAMDTMGDPQNQFDSQVAPKEWLRNAIQEILDN